MDAFAWDQRKAIEVPRLETLHLPHIGETGHERIANF
jgi:hypothetical protein